MNDLISQLFDIATNEEFSPDQRRMLMRIALNEFSDGNDPIGSIDGPSLNELEPYGVSKQQYIHALNKGMEAVLKIGGTPHTAKIAVDTARNYAIVIHVLGSNGTDDCIATIAVEPEPSPSSFVLDAALGRHLTKDRLADGTLRLGLAAHLPPSE